MFDLSASCIAMFRGLLSSSIDLLRTTTRENNVFRPSLLCSCMLAFSQIQNLMSLLISVLHFGRPLSD